MVYSLESLYDTRISYIYLSTYLPLLLSPPLVMDAIAAAGTDYSFLQHLVC